MFVPASASVNNQNVPTPGSNETTKSLAYGWVEVGVGSGLREVWGRVNHKACAQRDPSED